MGVTNEARAQDYWTCSRGESVTWPRDKKASAVHFMLLIFASRNRLQDHDQAELKQTKRPISKTQLN
nr:hypothetical protein CFP56_05244 [Quercus suber]